MADGTGGRALPSHSQAAAPDLQAIAADWSTIWQSELAAMATDREMHEAWARYVEVWAHAIGAAARLMPPPRTARADEPARHAGPATPPGAEAAMAAPDARDAAIQRLADRVDELEQRIRALTAGRSGTVGGVDPEQPGR